MGGIYHPFGPPAIFQLPMSVGGNDNRRPNRPSNRVATLESAPHDEGRPIPDLVVRVVARQLLEDLGDKRIRLSGTEN